MRFPVHQRATSSFELTPSTVRPCTIRTVEHLDDILVQSQANKPYAHRFTQQISIKLGISHNRLSCALCIIHNDLSLNEETGA